MSEPAAKLYHALWEVSAVFLKMGFTAFGGPAAHIAMFRHEVVQRRKWLSEQTFLDLLGATNLIPGPNSVEMAIHLGFLRAGWPGLLAGGLAFTLPAVLIVLAFSWLYVEYSAAPQAGWLLYGIKPVIIAIILQALWKLGRKALKSWLLLLVFVLVLGLYFLRVNEVLLLFAGGLLVLAIQNRGWLQQMRSTKMSGLLLPLLGAVGGAGTAVPFSLSMLFLSFLKIGATMYGSGYVLAAFMRADFVERLGWLTEQQLLDAIAIGQVTPGPLFTTATFIGYLLGGVPAAIIATLGIFLPSYLIVAISNPFIPRLRHSPWTSSLLDGVIAASLGLMAAVCFQLGRTALVDIPSLLIFLISAALLLRFNLNATWLVIGGALVGLLSMGWF